MSAPSHRWDEYADLAEASRALASWAAEQLRVVLEGEARASIALPGGSTPALFLGELARQPLPWPRLTLMPTDERCVPADHPRSNERMMRAALQPALEAGAQWLSLAASGPVDGPTDRLAGRFAARVAPLLPLSLVVCGMGEDGHIASLFPDNVLFGEPFAPDGPAIIASAPPGLEPRLSLSAEALREARQAALLIAGEKKRLVFAQALRQRDKPVAMLLDHDPPLRVFAARQG